ncbi:carotenoid biosynthesis protein [Mucilaginibacter sp.]
MEGTQNRLSRTTVAIIIIVIFHAVGLIGFFIGAVRPLFLQIVSFHLLLMLGVIIYSYPGPYFKFFSFALLIYLTGYAAEWIGVHKAWIFGDYYYGRTLGIQVYDIPLTMGINWFLLIYAAGVTMQRSNIKWLLVRVVSGALLLVLLDVLIEPVAQRFDYWHWSAAGVPFKNYVGWFAISVLSLLLFEVFKFKRQSLAGPVLLVVQYLFFALMQWV